MNWRLFSFVSLVIFESPFGTLWDFDETLESPRWTVLSQEFVTKSCFVLLRQVVFSKEPAPCSGVWWMFNRLSGSHSVWVVVNLICSTGQFLGWYFRHCCFQAMNLTFLGAQLGRDECSELFWARTWCSSHTADPKTREPQPEGCAL